LQFFIYYLIETSFAVVHALYVRNRPSCTSACNALPDFKNGTLSPSIFRRQLKHFYFSRTSAFEIILQLTRYINYLLTYSLTWRTDVIQKTVVAEIVSLLPFKFSVGLLDFTESHSTFKTLFSQSHDSGSITHYLQRLRHPPACVGRHSDDDG